MEDLLAYVARCSCIVRVSFKSALAITTIFDFCGDSFLLRLLACGWLSARWFPPQLFPPLFFIARLLSRSDLRIDIFHDDCTRFGAEIILRTTPISLLNYTQPWVLLGFIPLSRVANYSLWRRHYFRQNRAIKPRLLRHFESGFIFFD